MNLDAIFDFGKNGRLYKDFQEFTPLLTLTICLTVISLFVTLTFVYYFVQFKRRGREGSGKYFNQKLIMLTSGLMLGSMFFWILNFAFYYSAQSIFKTPNDALAVMITFLVIGFLLIFGSMGLIWFKTPYYGVVISNDKFWFLGENLNFTKVTKIITDEKSESLFINYIASARLFKYYRLKLNSGSAKFLIANLPQPLLVEVGNQTSYFKELTKTLPPQEKEAKN